ncbi:MAG: glycosyltransferase family 9 protein [Rhodospirillales bacterium]|nr:glycosyltransferase family 9 protein [Rhodospirillales bacterium]
MSGRHVLVVKLGALGDFVQAAGPFAAIRRHHKGDRITLLTTRPFADFASASPWFDAVWIDDRPRPWQVARWWRLRRRLRDAGFDRVYDLQTSDRSGWYFRLLGGGVEWSGIAPGCSHPHANPGRDLMHTLDRQAEQLRMAGIDMVEPPDLSWVTADVGRFGLPARYALMVPGGAPHRPAKRWPPENFAVIGRKLADDGVMPVLLGTKGEAPAHAAILAACPTARSLAGATAIADLVVLARGAVAALGNDTGPMHVAAAAGCPSLVLFSAESDPILCAPRGRVAVLRRERLAELGVGEVAAALAETAGGLALT